MDADVKKYVKQMKRVEFHFEDGTLMVAEGSEAQRFHEEFTTCMVAAVAQGFSPSRVKWTTTSPDTCGSDSHTCTSVKPTS